MAPSSPAIWLPGAVISHLRFISSGPFDGINFPQWRILGMIAYWFVYMLAMFWLRLVTTHVPEPYLDETFHIPQAQLYCMGRYDYWDPKLTTPPGLYIFATIFTKIRFSKWEPFDLRLFNATILPVAMLFALSCRHLILNSQSASGSFSVDTFHTTVNIVLFPPLFFFSGLFYTDLLSTCVVLATYRVFLHGGYGRWLVYPAGLVALSMRQTNIFWVAIFLGGLEVVRTLSAQPMIKKDDHIVPSVWKDRVRFEIDRWSRGNIHDISLASAGITDYILCVVSIIIAALHRPIQVMSRLLPYVALLVSFGTFVFWNGGVVLGDKSNHVATIHLPQLLYLFVFTAFFSLPLLITPALNFMKSLLALLELPIFPRLKWQYLFATTCCFGGLVVTLLIIKYNTIIHPFTLADNRHYVFYVFRYTILRHPLIRYLLAPIYLLCGWLVYLTLCSAAPITVPSIKNSKSKKSPKLDLKTKLNISETLKQQSNKQEGPKTSFLIIFLLTTALSLITAPLVEPRYFIIPWVIWRLHVPSLPHQPASDTVRTGQSNPRTQRALDWVKYWAYQGHDYRLWLETAYFLAINAVTGYVFLYRGFAWLQEPGKVQRFMW